MQQHWEKVYQQKSPGEVSWYRAHLESSLALIERVTAGRKDARVIDAGAGASTLVDDLLALGYRGLTVVDIAQAALDAARERLGAAGASVEWLRADLTQDALPERAYDVWHDRAVFHFLTDAADRAAYVRAVERSVKPGGHVIVSTFGPEGPRKCSGLDVVRYDSVRLHGEFGERFQLLGSEMEVHQTPWGAEQQFVTCYCMRLPQ